MKVRSMLPWNRRAVVGGRVVEFDADGVANVDEETAERMDAPKPHEASAKKASLRKTRSRT